MQTRRSFGQLLLGGIPASLMLGQADSKVGGVQMGVCTYSFRDLPHTAGGDAVDPVLQAFRACRASECELFSPQVEPAAPRFDRETRNSPEAKKAREDLRQWRLTTPMEHFVAVRQKFDQAGVTPFAYTVNFGSDYTDEEIDKCFQQAKAMRIKIIAASTQLTVAPRLVPFAAKHQVYVAMHGHSNKSDTNEFATPESFAKALSMSKYFRVNLDIGHFSAANFDAVEYIKANHQHITHLHIKDRKKDDGPNEPFGEGDTPIKQVLTLLKEKKYSIPAFVEYEYKGTGTSVEEVNKCLAFMKAALV